MPDRFHLPRYLLVALFPLFLLATCDAASIPPDRELSAPEEISEAAGDDERNEGAVVVIDSGLLEPTTPLLDLPGLGPAPEFNNDIWLNSEPLRLAELEGKVVLLEFWTFSCINCKRVIPYIRDWHERYDGEDFVVITVHYPEFGYEEDVDNVRDALLREQIEYAVAIDNDGLTWRAYNQRFWPTRYLIDKTGEIRYKHIGEGAYEETEAVIRQLLAEPAS